MEKIIDNKNGTYSFVRDGKILHTGKWGDKYVAPKVDKGEVIQNNKPNTPTKQADLKTKLGIPSFKPTITQSTQTSTLGPVVQNKPKINIFDFSSLQTPKAPSIPFKSTGPVAQSQTIQSPMLPTTTPMDTFKQGLPKVQPQVKNSIIPQVNAGENIYDEEKIKLFIEHGKRNGKSKEEIRQAYKKGIEQGIFNKDVIKSQQEPKKEAPGLFDGLTDQYKGMWNKTKESATRGFETIKSIGDEGFSPRSIAKGIIGTGDIISSPVQGVVGQGFESLVSEPVKLIYESFVPDNIKEKINSGTKEGLIEAKEWYDTRSPNVKELISNLGLTTEAFVTLAGGATSKTGAKQFIKQGDKALSKITKTGGELAGAAAKPILKSADKTLKKEVFEAIKPTGEELKKLPGKQTFAGNQKYEPSKYYDEIIENVKSDYNKDPNKFIKNITETGKKLDAENKTLASYSTAITNKNDFIKDINNIKLPASIKGNKTLINQFNSIKTSFVDEFLNKDNFTTLDKLKIRQEFDNWANREVPGIFKEGAVDSNVKKAVFNIRDYLNTSVTRETGTDAIENNLRKQSLGFKAIENIQDKLPTKEMTIMQKIIKKTVSEHPYLTMSSLGIGVGEVVGLTLLTNPILWNVAAGVGTLKLGKNIITSRKAREIIGKGLQKISDYTKGVSGKQKEELLKVQDIIKKQQKLLPAPSGKPLTPITNIPTSGKSAIEMGKPKPLKKTK